MLKPIFKRAEDQELFEKTGYLVVRQLISKDTVSKLRDIYFEYEKEHAISNLGMHSTVQTNNYEIVRDIYHRMEEMVSEYADKYLTNYKFYLGNFLIKESRNDSMLEMHQDWTCVDEPDFCSFNFWIDLDGRDKTNGRMFFLKGSDRLRQGLLRFAPEGLTPWEEIRDMAPQYYTYVNTDPGDVIFINNATLHGSCINKSGKSRLTAVLGAYSADASLLHYYLESGGALDKVERLLVNSENFINMPRGKRPPGSVFDGYATYDTPIVSQPEFIRFMMAQLSNVERLSIYGKKLKQAMFT